MSEDEKRKVTISRTFAITAKTEAQQLCAANPNRRGLLIANNGDGTVYLLSAQNLKYTDGIPILKQTNYSNDYSTNAYWIITSTGTQDIRVEVVSD